MVVGGKGLSRMDGEHGDRDASEGLQGAGVVEEASSDEVELCGEAIMWRREEAGRGSGHRRARGLRPPANGGIGAFLRW